MSERGGTRRQLGRLLLDGKRARPGRLLLAVFVPVVLLLAAQYPADAQAADPLGDLAEATYANGLVYLNETWWPDVIGDDRFPFVFGGRREQHIRGPAMAAYAMASASRLAFFPAEGTSVSPARNRRRAVLLTASLARRHEATRAGGWGREWQSGLWSYYVGMAAWMVWDGLDPADRTAVRRMLRAEAQRLAGRPPRSAFAADGTPLTPGDTKAEEDAWNGSLLLLASAFPYGRFGGAERRRWEQTGLDYAYAAYATPDDGLAGYNMTDAGELMNHGIVHPDYMVAATQSYLACLIYGMAGRPVPGEVFHNGDVVWDTLTRRHWPSPPYDAPGGTIYLTSADGSPAPGLYFPQGNDWGTAGMGRRINMAQEDLFAFFLGFSDGDDALAFGVQHLLWVYQQQERHADKHLYEPGEYDFGHLRNETFGVAQMAENLAVYRYFTTGRVGPAYGPGAVGP